MSIYDKVKPTDLSTSVKSMLEQSVMPEQFVVVWDGPVKSELHEIINNYSILYPNIFTIVQLDENMGLAYALNLGLKVCRNELVARMDSDDISLPTRCQKQLELFDKNKELVLIGTATARFINDPNQLLPNAKYHPSEIDAIRKMARRSSPFSHPTVMFKKSVILKFGGYDPTLRRSQDLDLFTRVVSEGYMCTNIDEVLLLYRIDENYIARNKSKETCKNRVLIQKKILKRGGCSIIDYFYVWLAMQIALYAPNSIYTFLHNHVTSKKSEK